METWGKILTVIGIAAVCMAAVGIMKKPSSVFKNKPEEQNPMEGKKVRLVENENEKPNADGVCGHLEAIGESDQKTGIYDKYIKRCLDVVLSFIGLIVLSPVYLALSLWIVIDDPGPILFTQKRIGKNKQYFIGNKFFTVETHKYDACLATYWEDKLCKTDKTQHSFRPATSFRQVLPCLGPFFQGFPRHHPA